MLNLLDHHLCINPHGRTTTLEQHLCPAPHQNL